MTNNLLKIIGRFVPALALAMLAGCAAGTTTRPAADAVPRYLAAETLQGAEEGLKTALDAGRGGDWEAAYRFSRRVAEEYPATPSYKRALFLMERSLIQLGRTEEAEAAMLRVQAEYPDLADYAVFLLAEHHYSASRFSRAAALYQHLTERYPKSYLAALATFKRSKALLESYSYAEAADAFGRFLRDNPQSDLAPEAGLGLARALTGVMDMAAAVRAYQDIFISSPGNSVDDEVEKELALLRNSGIEVPDLTAEELYRRGRALFRTRQFDKAYASLSAAIGKDPEHPQRADISLKMGIALFYMGKRSESAEVLERSIKEIARDGRGPEALNWLGKAYSKIGEREKAVQNYLRIVTSYPDSEWADEALYLIGNVYRDANDTKNALKFYGRLAEEFPESSFADSAIWWKAWAYYSSGDYGRSEQTLRTLVSRYPKSFLVNQAIYWLGRSCEKRGDESRAAVYYRKALKRSPYTYYGYLASERLSAIETRFLAASAGAEADIGLAVDAGDEAPPTDLDEVDGPPVWTDEAVRALSSDPSYRKVLELTRLEMKKEAAAELWALQDRMTAKRGMLLGLSKTFFELGDYYRSLLLVLRNYERYLEGPAAGAPRDFWLLAYPQAYWDSITARARQYGQDPYFIAAVIRQESHFQTDALSPAGARGVMQLMPSTGEWAALAIKLSGFDRSMLLSSDVNINVGTWYVGQLMKRFKNDPLFTAAAYNAGPAAVAGWIDKSGPSFEKDEFVESIPYTETRWYVKRVLANYAEYRRIYGRSGKAVKLLAKGQNGTAPAYEYDSETDIP